MTPGAVYEHWRNWRSQKCQFRRRRRDEGERLERALLPHRAGRDRLQREEEEKVGILDTTTMLVKTLLIILMNTALLNMKFTYNRFYFQTTLLIMVKSKKKTCKLNVWSL